MSEINNEPIPNAAGPETTAEKAESEQKISEPIIVKYDEDKEKEDKPAQPPKEIEMKDMTKKTPKGFKLSYSSNLEVVSVDSGATELLGYSKEEMLHHDMTEFIEKDYLRERTKTHLIEVLTTETLKEESDIDIESNISKKAKKIIITFIKKDSVPIDILVNDIRQVDDDAYSCYFTDATEMMRRKRSDTYNYINSISSANSGIYNSIGGYVQNSLYSINWNQTQNSNNSITMERTMSSTSGDLIIEMNEMYTKTQNTMPKGQWVNTGVYHEGMEDNQSGNTGYGAVSLNGFAYLRQLLEEGVVLFDEPCEDVKDCIDLLLDKFEDNSVIDTEHHALLHSIFVSDTAPLTTTPTMDKINDNVESCKVFITSVPYVEKPVAGLIRVTHPIYGNTEVPIRYVLVIVGKDSVDKDYHDIGRAFSLMMAQGWFYSYAKKITSKHRFIKLMDAFLRRCVMLPPLDMSFHPGLKTSDNKDVHVKHCCQKSSALQTEEQTLTVSMPQYRNMDRANTYLDKRRRIMAEQDQKNIKLALQAEPTAAEVDDQQLPVIESVIRIKDYVWGGIILLLCIGVACFLNIYNLVPYSDGLHTVEMSGYPMEMVGGYKSIAAGTTKDFEILQTPRGLYEVKLALERSPDGLFSYQLMEETEDGVRHNVTDYFVVSTSADSEVESLNEIDLPNLGSGKLSLRTKFESLESKTSSLSFSIDCTPMNSIGRYRVIIGIVILVLVYGLLLAEVVHRTVCAFIGAFLTLLLLAITTSAPELSRVITFIDSSTICLLFGMMVMVQTLSTTGLFEWAAVKAVKISGGRPLVLNIVLCLLTAVLSAFLDNVTTMLLIAPVTIELCRVLNSDPIPFLIPEVLFSNIGGTATMIGDPPNIMIGNLLSEYVSFIDFITDIAPCCLIVMVFAYLYLYGLYHKSLKNDKHEVSDEIAKKYNIKNKPLLLKAGIILLTVIVLLFLHTVHGIDAAYLTLAGAFSVLLLCKPEEIKHTFELLEWETLLFFAGLFVMIEGMNEMGVIRAIGNGVASVIRASPSESRLSVAILMILWVSGIASSILDNIPFTATIIPIILQLHNDPELALPVRPLAWALALGACLGGNGTLVGASANLVTAGIANSHGYKITFLSFLLPGYPTLFISLIISSLYLLTKYVWAA